MGKMRLLYGVLGALFLSVSFGCYSLEYIDVYTDQQVPYQETRYRTEAVYLPPIIDRDGMVVAFTPIWGAEHPTVSRVSEAVRLGFLREGMHSDKTIVFVSEGEMVQLLQESALHDFGEDILKRLQWDLAMNVLGTGTIMLDSNAEKRLSMQAFDLKERKTYDRIYSGTSWEDVGVQIAQDFYGTAQVFQQVPYQVQKYRTETVLSGKEAIRVPKGKSNSALYLIVLTAGAVIGTLLLVMNY